MSQQSLKLEEIDNAIQIIQRLFLVTMIFSFLSPYFPVKSEVLKQTEESRDGTKSKI